MATDKGPVIRIEGPIYKAVGIPPNRISDFKVGKYSFSYADFAPGLMEKSDVFKEGAGNVAIEFSPHSKVIWSIRKVS